MSDAGLVRLRPGKEAALRAGRPWVYRGEVAAVEGAPASGDVVAVTDARGNFLARAFYHESSLLAARVLTRDAALSIDDAFFHGRLAAAIDYRRRLLGPERTDDPAGGCRLVHAEADGLPGLVVDRLGPVLVVQCLTVGIERRLGLVCDALRELTGIADAFERNTGPVRRLEGLPERLGPLRGHPPDTVRVREGPVLFEVDLRLGQKTGHFLDQQDNRRRFGELVRRLLATRSPAAAAASAAPAGAPHGATAAAAASDAAVPAAVGPNGTEGPAPRRPTPARGTVGSGARRGRPTAGGARLKPSAHEAPAAPDPAGVPSAPVAGLPAARGGPRVLDAFCHTGGFGLQALAAGAAEVVFADTSAPALAAVERNAALNALAGAETIEANAFDLLRRLQREGRRFDAVVLDPPAFARGAAQLDGAYRGYKEINLRAMRLLAPGGLLCTSSCSQPVSAEMFATMLRDAATDAGRRLRVIEQRGAAPDHPGLLGADETHYLKCFFLQAVD